MPNQILLKNGTTIMDQVDYRQDNTTGYKETFFYDPSNRLKSWYVYKNNVLQKGDSITFNATTGNIANKTDIGNYAMNYEDEVNAAGVQKMIHYLGDGAVYIYNNGKDSLLFMYRDYLGSLVTLTNSTGAVLERYAYDPWGGRRNPADWTQKDNRTSWRLNRGYTGHEHLDAFGIINMNGRVYDPLTAQFFSPDPYLQAPNNWLNYNRYSYAWNNPMLYTDPNGEFLGIALRALTFFGGSLSNWINGYSDPIGSAWASSGRLTNEFANCAQIPVYSDSHTRISVGLDPLALGVSANAIYKNGKTTWSGGFGFGLLGGWFGDGGVSYSTNSTKGWTFGAGVGAGNNYWGWNASVITPRGGGVGYGQTYYGNALGPDGKTPNPQTVGNITAYWKGGSFTLQNDVKWLSWKQGDRWRTNGFELTIGDFSFGNTIYTNDGKADSEAVYGEGDKAIDFDAKASIYGKNSQPGKGAWRIGKVYSAPAWIGYRIGNQVSRVGYSSRFFQNLFQNGIHTTPLGNQNYYLDYHNFNKGLYGYSGYYNPFTLWGH